MPHEKINYPRRRPLPQGVTVSVPSAAGLQATFDGGPIDPQLVVEWNSIGWVQVALYPDGWRDTGDAPRTPLNPQELDLLIATLKRARRQAYGKGRRHEGYEDFRDQEPISPRPLWEPRPAEDSGPAPLLDCAPFLPSTPAPPQPVSDEMVFEDSTVVEHTDETITDSGGDGYWGYDADGSIRDRLYEVFGIETDGGNVRPDDVFVTLTQNHHLDSERAHVLVWGSAAQSGEFSQASLDEAAQEALGH